VTFFPSQIPTLAFVPTDQFPSVCLNPSKDILYNSENTVPRDEDVDILGGSLGRDTGRQTQRVLESQLDEYGEYWSVRFTPDTILDDLLGQC